MIFTWNQILDESLWREFFMKDFWIVCELWEPLRLICQNGTVQFYKHKTLPSCRLLSPAGTLKRKCLWADRYCQPHTMNLEHIWGFQEDGSKGHLWRVCVLWKTFDWWALQVVAGGRMPKPGHHTYASWSHPTQFKSRRAMMTIWCQHCDSH